MVTQNLNTVTEEEQITKDNTRYAEIKKKPESERTADEKKEFGELIERHGSRSEKRIGQLSGKVKTTEEDRDRERQEKETAQAKIKELEGKVADSPTTVVGDVNETVEIGGKKYYTDNALSAQIKAGTITEQAGIDYQSQRNEEKTVVRVKGDLKKEQEADAAKKSQAADAQAVLDAHPEFGVKHADHNPNDPLYIEWKELVANGYGLTNGGLMKALKKAKKNLGIKDTHIDRSSELGIEEVIAPGEKGGEKGKEKEVTLTDVEEDSAVSMFTSVPNPATGRLYTRDEAIAKAKAAKAARRK